MADAKHKVERAAFGAAIDGILKYVNKDETDREKAFLKLVDLSEKFMGDTFRKESYDAARRMIQDPDILMTWGSTSFKIRFTYCIHLLSGSWIIRLAAS